MDTPNAMARATDPDTSREAAESVDSVQMERIVLEAIAQFPNGCIADELERVLPGYRWNTITPRFAPLIRKGLIYDTGERRKARSGRSQRVLRVEDTVLAVLSNHH
jgi:hypothetical protein